MGLQVWLPLNGNLDNQGVADIPNMSISSCEWIDGKIGKCIKIPKVTTNNITISELNGCKKFSFCCWLYLDTSYTNSSYTRIFSLGNVSDDNTGYIRIETIPTNGQFQIIYNKSSTHGSGTSATVTYYGITGGDTDAGSNKWVHITVTNDGTNVRTYFNGILKGTWKTNTIYDEGYLNGQLYLGGSYVNLNDVRIYDHCLSAKEVKEIAKGLVCHYPLKSQYDTGQVNKYSDDTAEGSLNISPNFTKTKLENERGYNYKLSYTGTGSNVCYVIAANNFSFTPGKKYYYSCKVRCHSSNFAMSFRAARVSNDYYSRNAVYVLTNPDGEWHEYVVSTIINNSFVYNSNTITCNPKLEFYTDNLSTSGKVYSADFDIKDVQVIESDCYVPFIDNSISSNIIGDCSGYGNDGVRNGTINWSNNSLRYNGSYRFPTTAYIDCGTGGKVTDEITVNIWCYMDTWPIDQRLISCTDSGGWNFESNNGKISFPVYIKDSGYISAISSKLWTDLISGWHMFTGTYDGYNAKLYIDGELEKTVSNGKSNKTGIGYHSTNHIYIHAESTYDSCATGYNECNLSDCRIYATALSADDVKSLYNTSASLSKNGILLAYEFNEEE